MKLNRAGVSLLLLFVAHTAVHTYGNPPTATEKSADSEPDLSMWGFRAKDQEERIRSVRAKGNAEFLAAIATKETINEETVAELLRRASPKCLSELQRRYDSCRTERIKATLAEPDVRRPENYELLLLSALHQAKHLPDPLPVVIKGDMKREVTFPEMPHFEVAIVNKHPEQREICWEEGGNYRHGRRESFGFDVHRDDGELMPIVPPPYGTGGGIISFVELKSGEKWANEMPLASYVKRLPVGKYKVRAAYAFADNIGMIPDKSATFMCFSKTIELVVARRTVRLAPSERTQADRLCHGLPTDGAVKIVEGGYDKQNDAEFIAPDSAPGQILQLGWKAVPALIALVADKNAKPVQRAWAFALLYSITGENNPFGEDADSQFRTAMDGPLGPSEVREAGWIVLDGKGVGGVRPVQTNSYSGKINAKEQAKLSEQWIIWKKNIEVVESPESHQ